VTLHTAVWPLVRWWRRRSAPGPRGERVAARWLRRRGYRILARNLVLGSDEADLLVRAPDGRTTVIVEVKSRVGPDWPEARVDRAKQRRLARLGRRVEHDRSASGGAATAVRFDVVAVNFPPGPAQFAPGGARVRHFEDAFEVE
jgi:putative endonuclease